MPIKSKYFPGTRTVTNTWYSEAQIKDLGKTWEHEEHAGEDRSFNPDLTQLTPEFLKALPKDRPSKFMFYKSLGGNHWIGIGVVVVAGKVTVALSNSLKKDHEISVEEQELIEEIALPFQEVFGADKVKKGIYERTWEQTDWRGIKEESPNSCGAYTIENMRRFLACSKVADDERNPGSLSIRERQLINMKEAIAIKVVSNSDKLMDVAKEFNKHYPSSEKFTTETLDVLFQNPDFRKEIVFERGMKNESDLGKSRDGIISSLNRYLSEVRKIQEKENTLKENLLVLKKSMGEDAFKEYAAKGFNLNIDISKPSGFELIMVQSTLPTLTPSACDRVITENFPGIEPPFIKLEQEKFKAAIIESDSRLAQELWEKENEDRVMRKNKEEGASRYVVVAEMNQRIKDINKDLQRLEKMQTEYNKSSYANRLLTWQNDLGPEIEKLRKERTELDKRLQHEERILKKMEYQESHTKKLLAGKASQQPHHGK